MTGRLSDILHPTSGHKAKNLRLKILDDGLRVQDVEITLISRTYSGRLQYLVAQRDYEDRKDVIKPFFKPKNLEVLVFRLSQPLRPLR